METKQESELWALYRSIVRELEQSTTVEDKHYYQGKKDGIRIAQIILRNDTAAAHGLITTDNQERVHDDEYNIALAVADGRRRKLDG